MTSSATTTTIAASTAAPGSGTKPPSTTSSPGRYRLDLGHNYVLADVRCNGYKRERLAAVEHLQRWQARNRAGSWSTVLAEESVPANLDLTRRVAVWAYGQAEKAGSTVWSRGADGLVALDSRWRALLAQSGGSVAAP